MRWELYVATSTPENAYGDPPPGSVGFSGGFKRKPHAARQRERPQNFGVGVSRPKTGKMGRHPTPTSLKVLRGNPGQRPLNADEPQPPPADPNPPAGLAGIALDKWDEMVDLLSKMGVFTQADRQPLQRYCLMYEQWLALEAHCKEHGWTQVTQTGYSQITAEATLIKSLRADMLAIERQFGMTPAARSSIKAPGASAPENPLAAYISRRGG